MNGLRSIALTLVLLALATVVSAATAQRLVVTEVILTDSRILDLDGQYALNSGLAHSCVLDLVQDTYGSLIATITIDGVGAGQPFALTGRMKPILSDDMLLTLKGRSSDGWSAEIAGTFVAGGSSFFNLHIVLNGPDGVTEYDHTLTPSDSDRTFRIYGKHDVGGADTWYLDLPDAAMIDGIATKITKITSPTKLTAKGESVSLSLRASVINLETLPQLIPEAGMSGKVKIGKMLFKQHQIRWNSIKAALE